MLPGDLQVLHRMGIMASFISRFLSPADVTCITLPWLLGLPAPVCWYRTPLDVPSQAGVCLSSLLPAPERMDESWLHLVFSNPAKSSLVSEQNQDARTKEEGVLALRVFWHAAEAK